MKKKIEIIFKKEEKEIVEVEFPMYSFKVLIYPTIYTRIDQNLKAIHIDLERDGTRIELEISEPDAQGWNWPRG